MKKILFLCTGNSCRSQMAEGMANHLWQGRIKAESAGTFPATRVNPDAVRAMAEIGVDISRQFPKDSSRFVGEKFDYIITLCDSANQICPAFPGRAERLHWSIPDPYGAEGSPEEVLEVYRATRERIRERIEKLVGGA